MKQGTGNRGEGPVCVIPIPDPQTLTPIFPPVHLYLHVPFCQRRCSYCDFSIAVRKSIPAREYVAAIRSEIARPDPVFPTPGASSFMASPGKRESEDTPTIYLGGGTPSLLPPEAI